MVVKLIPVPEERKKVLSRLAQLYLYDFSEIEGFDIGEDGLYTLKHLDSYWTKPDRHPFFILAGRRIAGFALVNTITYAYKRGEANSVAEFFVMRKYRRRGIGREAARRLFNAFPGKWEVRQTTSNVAGQLFWRSVIAEYAGGKFEETFINNKFWRGPAQLFDTTS
ncbi:MAG: GNAT family N-acetyltransferase [Candidatus Abyssobacteria bacterium SURF_5]|uniref:GNAT family N-acetyltransferase n=1 Tax=Abyssobacteria bacterium (strain SURF_5) TaxID=2093360 RepID=A0A3A4NLW3_ABYX5|nr:MAG: GNAT family N-acetyltransferase [Candidatus Abyssubacteria bacterium SURF_5]